MNFIVRLNQLPCRYMDICSRYQYSFMTHLFWPLPRATWWRGGSRGPGRPYCFRRWLPATGSSRFRRRRSCWRTRGRHSQLNCLRFLRRRRPSAEWWEGSSCREYIQSPWSRGSFRVTKLTIIDSTDLRTYVTLRSNAILCPAILKK